VTADLAKTQQIFWNSGLVNISESGAIPLLWVKKEAIGLN
jgi:hypothetical protein